LPMRWAPTADRPPRRPARPDVTSTLALTDCSTDPTTSIHPPIRSSAPKQRRPRIANGASNPTLCTPVEQPRRQHISSARRANRNKCLITMSSARSAYQLDQYGGHPANGLQNGRNKYLRASAGSQRQWGCPIFSQRRPVQPVFGFGNWLRNASTAGTYERDIVTAAVDPSSHGDRVFLDTLHAISADGLAADGEVKRPRPLRCERLRR
jgi:hypothetical protein